MIEGKQKIPKLIIALGITFVICFALWVKAYSAGAVATPPAVLVFGPEKVFMAKTYLYVLLR